MTAGVYAIVNTATGTAYVGSSVNIERRWNGRRSALNRGASENKALQADWTTLRGAGFELRILQETESTDAALAGAEDQWIATLREASTELYNVRGGHVGRFIPLRSQRGRRRPAQSEAPA
jgi:hypothetical protein